MGKVEYSAMESEQFGFRFGRYNASGIDSEEIVSGVVRENLDVLRIRCSAADENAVSSLEEMGIPYFYSGGIRRYRVNCKDAPLPDFTHPEIGFELYTGQSREVLKEIMLESWGDYPLGYYRSPVLSDFISKEHESECLFNFYSEKNNNTNYPDNYLWFVKWKEDYIGFIALYAYRHQDMVDSTIAGFKKAWQGKGLFPNILRHIRAFCRLEGLTWFCCGARNENVYSQWAFETDFMKGEGVEYVYHLLPMWNRFQQQAEPQASLSEDMFRRSSRTDVFREQLTAEVRRMRLFSQGKLVMELVKPAHGMLEYRYLPLLDKGV